VLSTGAYAFRYLQSSAVQGAAGKLAK